MDMTAVTSAYNGLKVAKDIFNGFIDQKAENASLDKINDALKKVGEAQDTLFQLREELFKLQDDNNSLKEIISENEEWEKKASKYSLVKSDGGAVIYASTLGLEHYICPNCFENKKVQILQDDRVAAGTYSCPGCKSNYPIKTMKYFGTSIAFSD